MKKILSLALSLIMIFSVLVVFADDASQMQELLVYVKSKIEVPSEFSEFNTNYYEDKNLGRKEWSFNWNKPSEAGSYGYLSVSIDEDKIIKSYSKYTYDDKTRYDGKKLNLLSVDEAKDIAVKFFEKLNPSLVGEFDFSTTDYFYIGDQNYTFTFFRRHEGLKHLDNSLSIDVNARSGEVTGMYLTYEPKIEYEKIENVVDIKDILSKIKNGKITLRYLPVYNYEDGSVTARLVYSADSILIDAKTGEDFKSDTYYGYGGGYGDYRFDEQAKVTDSGLTPQELAEIEEVSGLLPKDEVIEIIKGIKELSVDDTYELSDINLYTYKRGNQKEYTYDVSFVQKDDKKPDYEWARAYFSVDAKTGLLKSFYAYSDADYYGDRKDSKKEKNFLPDEKLEEIAANFINTYYKEKADKVKYKKQPDDQYTIQSERKTLYFVNIVNGLEFEANTINFTLNRETGKITAINYIWYDNVKFEDPKNADSTAADALIEALKVNLAYISAGYTGKLVYTKTSNVPGIIDAISKKLLYFNGEEYKETEGVKQYKDLEGHWAKEYIEKLSQTGIIFDSDEFRPDDKITQKDYLELVMQATNYYVAPIPYDVIYQFAKQSKLIEVEDPDGELTKEMAVTILLKAAGYEKVASLEGIFKTGFMDEAEIAPELVGYVAIAKGFKIINGDENGNFLPKKALTRAEAAIIIYNYLR